ncbi:MAG: hypothetical protein AVDCRST_MAG73-817, partial [uncultured Thermomicrobiales bacterium]
WRAPSSRPRSGHAAVVRSGDADAIGTGACSAVAVRDWALRRG